MPAIFEYELTVTDDAIDGQGHVNNLEHVRWMQEAAVAHSAAQGWPSARYRQLGAGWVVRSHTIEYHRPALAGDKILIRTWVATMEIVTSLRRYRILRQEGAALLAVAETVWAFIDYRTGRPKRIPDEIAAAFPVVRE